MAIRITAEFTAEPEELDDASDTGINQECYDELMQALDEAGLTDITVRRV